MDNAGWGPLAEPELIPVTIDTTDLDWVMLKHETHGQLLPCQAKEFIRWDRKILERFERVSECGPSGDIE